MVSSDARSPEEELEFARRQIRSLEQSVSALRHEVVQLESQLESAETQLSTSWDQLRQLRRSRSWQLTAPLRALRRRR